MPNSGTVAVAVANPRLRRALTRWLERSGHRVSALATTTGLPDRVRSAKADVVVVAEAGIDLREIRAIADGAAGGEVVLLAEDDDPSTRAGLVAAGIATILDADAPTAELATDLEALAGASARGGLAGPEEGRGRGWPHLADFTSRSPRLRELVDVARRVAASDSSLLIRGETGVGKGRLARAIHAESRRVTGPFVAVNCGALPETLLDSELFGHEAGAFTDARTRRKGRFEEAGGGTLFLDEIGELPVHLQVKLLSVIQYRRLRRVGGSEEIPVDVRIMAATNRDLEADAKEGRFREDLFYRLNVVPLVIPPLRERPEDIPELVGSFIRHLRRELDRPEVEGVDETAMRALMRHGWPGNVRELMNVVERAMLLAAGRRVMLSDLPRPIRGLAPGALLDDEGAALGRKSGWLDRPLREVRREATDRLERAYLEAQLRRSGGRVGDAARRSGISARALHDKMKRHALRKEDFRSPG